MLSDKRRGVSADRSGRESASAARTHQIGPAWKGMGTSGCPSPPCCLSTPPLLAVLLTLAILILSAEGFKTNSGCKIDSCWSRYDMVRTSIEQRATLAGTGLPDLSADDTHCVALRTYLHCIKRIKENGGCHGDIRYFSVRNGVKNQMKQHNCSHEGRTIDTSKITPASPSTPRECAYSGRKVFKQCGLFGDPHLRTFYGEFQTCKVKGAWPLVNNKFLTVQVTNDAIAGDSGATATSKLTVIIKKNNVCASDTFQMYQAQTDYLPSSFYDGRTDYGPHKSVELVEVEAGKHVEIHIRYIETTILVRQIGRYLTFNIRMPADIVNESSNSNDMELCVSGCPESERINYQEYLAQRRNRITSFSGSSDAIVVMPRAEAHSICREAKVVDFYFDSCVFDLMVTGDKNFTLAAVSALQDVLQLDPDLLKSLSDRVDFSPYDQLYGGGVCSTRTQSVWLVWLTLLLSTSILLSSLCCEIVRV
ncbi:RGM domain family member B-like isoform X2 [Gigantopelta aegis]|uniref:RGM domain family member B-like isoform X2 n=1 Tax=Gigantopelta aegis TaxID=1735272 RepID=UPI001B88AC29|nr:RGM domain family member B-like isoform X2 [Gigantopelta aegis]